MRDRKTLVHAAIDPAGRGIEIGVAYAPLAPKREGYKVTIIDHTDANGLRVKYGQHGLNLDAIEEVDHVWTGGNFANLVGQRHYYDWVIASHVVEHTPCLISFFNNCDEVLKDTGVLVLVVPDKRYCSIYFVSRRDLRASSTLSLTNAINQVPAQPRNFT